MSFDSHSDAGTGWDGRGVGTVGVSEPEPGVFVFDEVGTWSPNRGSKSLHFTNVFRWTRGEHTIRLEHLRLGPDRPVLLFDLALTADSGWRPVDDHVCGADCYAGRLCLSEDAIRFTWTIIGPRKRETIRYVYS